MEKKLDEMINVLTKSFHSTLCWYDPKTDDANFVLGKLGGIQSTIDYLIEKKNKEKKNENKK